MNPFLYSPYQTQQDPNAGRMFSSVAPQTAMSGPQMQSQQGPQSSFSAQRPRQSGMNQAMGYANTAGSLLNTGKSLYGMFGSSAAPAATTGAATGATTATGAGTAAAGAGSMAAVAPIAGAYGLALNEEFGADKGALTGSQWGDLGLSLATGGFTSLFKAFGGGSLF